MSKYKEAVEMIMGQLSFGYIDLGTANFEEEKAIDVVHKAMEQYIKTHDDNGNLISNEVM